MVNKLNTYSQRYCSFIKENIKTTEPIYPNELMDYYNIIKKELLPEIEKVKHTTLIALRDKTDNYLVMDNLKKISPDTLKKYIKNIVGIDETNNLLHYLDTNDKNKFASWIVLHHRLIPPVETITKSIYKSTNDRKNLHTLLYENPFVSLNIQNYYETHTVRYSHHNHNDISLHLYEYLTMPKINPTDVFHIVNIMRKLFKKNINVKIVILGSPFKKKLFNIFNDKVILPIHVNSGSTLKGSYVNVWRYEEWQKVLIHEMIHYLEVDFNYRSRGYNKLVSYLDNKFNIDGNIIPSEAYTELLAVIFHTMYIIMERRRELLSK